MEEHTKINYFGIECKAVRENKRLIKDTISSFAMQIMQIKKDQSQIIIASMLEAFDNAIEYAYQNEIGNILVQASFYDDNILEIIVTDYGCGIEDVEEATKPWMSSGDANSHSGMGFTVMQAYADEVKIETSSDEGTTVKLIFKI